MTHLNGITIQGKTIQETTASLLNCPKGDQQLLPTQDLDSSHLTLGVLGSTEAAMPQV